jgi:hypothetical protein
MGTRLNLETPKEIDIIQIDTPTETQNTNAPEQPIKKIKYHEIYSDV